MQSPTQKLRTDRAIAGVVAVALVIIAVMTFIARSSIQRADDEITFFEEDLVAPSREFKVMSDLYAVEVEIPGAPLSALDLQ